MSEDTPDTPVSCELSKIFDSVSMPVALCFLRVGQVDNSITFRLQEGPIKENGVNGCQIDHIIWAAATILRAFNKKFPCRENSIAITNLDDAILWLEKRTKDREKRNAEGRNVL